jgi:membrane-associated phospholipid phosphatase
MSGKAGNEILSILAVAAVLIFAQGVALAAESHFVAPPLFSLAAGSYKAESDASDAVKIDHREGTTSRRYLKYGLAAVGVGALLFALDEEIKDFSQWDNIHSRRANRFADKVGNLGTTDVYVATGAFLIGYGALTRSWKGVWVSGELAVGFLLEEGITQANKTMFGRLRPYRTDSQFRFFKGGTSFTSGHAATAFTFATIMAKSYPRQDLGFIGIDREVPVVPILSYTIAGVVGLQRLYVNAHWSSDVYGGALVGYGVGSAVVYVGKKLQLKSVGVIPGRTPMVAASFSFGTH